MWGLGFRVHGLGFHIHMFEAMPSFSMSPLGFNLNTDKS